MFLTAIWPNRSQMQQLKPFEILNVYVHGITEGDASCTASRCRWYEAACLGRSGAPFCRWDPTPAPAAPARSVWLSRCTHGHAAGPAGAGDPPTPPAKQREEDGVQVCCGPARQRPTIMAALHIGLHSPPPRPPTASPRDSDAPPRPRIPAGADGWACRLRRRGGGRRRVPASRGQSHTRSRRVVAWAPGAAAVGSRAARRPAQPSALCPVVNPTGWQNTLI